MKRTLIASLAMMLMVPAMALAARPKPQQSTRTGPGAVVYHPLYEKSLFWSANQPRPKYSGPQLFAVTKAEGNKIENSIRAQLGLKRDTKIVLFDQGFNTKGLTPNGMELNYRFAVIPGESSKAQTPSGGVVSMGIKLEKRGAKQKSWNRNVDVWDGIVDKKSISVNLVPTTKIKNLKLAPPEQFEIVSPL